MQSVDIKSHTFQNLINESWNTHYMNFILFMLNVKTNTTLWHSSITTDETVNLTSVKQHPYHVLTK